MGISKRKRFDVFKRDGFTCQYCGRVPPVVVLQCDHIEPKCAGGTDELDNLITACFDCNSGKSGEQLETIPGSVAAKMQLIEEREEQMAAYSRLLARVKRNKQKRIAEVVRAIDSRLEAWGQEVNDNFKLRTIGVFLDRGLTVPELIEYFDLAYVKFSHATTTRGMLKYFCGICWKQIKARKGEENAQEDTSLV